VDIYVDPCRGRYLEIHRMNLVMRSITKPLPREFQWSACAERSVATDCRSNCWARVNVVQAGGEIGRYLLLTLIYVSRKDGVDTDMQANGTVVKLIFFDERVYKSRIRRDLVGWSKV